MLILGLASCNDRGLQPRVAHDSDLETPYDDRTSSQTDYDHRTSYPVPDNVGAGLFLFRWPADVNDSRLAV
jgi:hypothetical protein